MRLKMGLFIKNKVKTFMLIMCKKAIKKVISEKTVLFNQKKTLLSIWNNAYDA